MALKAQSWTIEATEALLSLWGRENVQKQIKKSTFENISYSMISLGYDFSWKQCRTRVRNLTYSYRKAVRESGGMDEGSLEKKAACQFFKELDIILNPSEDLVHPVFQTSSEEDGRDQVEEQFLSPLVEVSSPEEQEESLPEEQKQVLFVEQNLPDVTRTTSGEEQVTHGEDPSPGHRRKALDDNVMELVALLQEEAEDREDARQQRLLEHETRMEERRQHWEEQRRERELQIQRQWEEQRREREQEQRKERELEHRRWEEQRREKEFQQQQQLVQMFLQGLEHLKKKKSATDHQ